MHCGFAIIHKIEKLSNFLAISDERIIKLRDQHGNVNGNQQAFLSVHYCKPDETVKACDYINSTRTRATVDHDTLSNDAVYLNRLIDSIIPT